jgi:hypothetical protein
MTLAMACGVVLAVGTLFTLAFLPLGLIVALLIAFTPNTSHARRVWVILGVGGGFLFVIALGWALTGANPLTVWSWNLKNHARFYLEYPRTYIAWLILNPIELAVALGLPAAVLCALGLTDLKSAPRAAWATVAVVLLLNVIGRNLGEVARLWLLFLPPILTAAGTGFDRLAGGPWALGVSAALLGLQTLALQTMVQVVYPV